MSIHGLYEYFRLTRTNFKETEAIEATVAVSATDPGAGIPDPHTGSVPTSTQASTSMTPPIGFGGMADFSSSLFSADASLNSERDFAACFDPDNVGVNNPSGGAGP